MATTEAQRRASAKYAQSKKGKISRAKVVSKRNESGKNREYKQKYASNKYKTDPQYRVLDRLRNRLYQATKGIGKVSRAQELLGCSVEELLVHLNDQFTEGMTWENQGEWHIDHIKPCASFDLTIEEERNKCFHFTNMQPLWALDNLKKSDKY